MKFKKFMKKVFPILLTVLMLSVIFCISVAAEDVTSPQESIIDLLKTMLSVLGDCITTLMNAIKTGFMSLIFVDPAAGDYSVSAVGIWIFVMLGLSLALSLGYYIIGIVHRRG